MLIAITAFGQQKSSELRPKPAPDIPLILKDTICVSPNEYPTLAMFKYIEDYDIRKYSSDFTMLTFIYRNIEYLPITRCTAIDGTVVIGFIIEKNGSMTNVQIIRGIGGGLGEEAMRVIKLLPKFSPAMKDGKPVRFQYHIPVRFGMI